MYGIQLTNISVPTESQEANLSAILVKHIPEVLCRKIMVGAIDKLSPVSTLLNFCECETGADDGVRSRETNLEDWYVTCYITSALIHKALVIGFEPTCFQLPYYKCTA